MRILMILAVYFFSQSLISQTKQHLGISLGTTFFTSDTDAFNSTTVPGLSIGLVANFEYNKRSELSFGIKYNRHVLEFDGRSNEGSPVESVRLNLKQLEFPLTYTYNVIALEKFSMGFNAGASANLFYEYRANNESQKDYILEPNGIKASDLFFGTKDTQIGFNLFLIVGLDFKFFEKFKITPRFYYGTVNPYKQAPEDNPLSDYTSQLSYFYLGCTYFL